MSDPITRLNAALEGRYTIERELGEGGMATVYLADDLKHERKVALKVLKPELAAVVGAERFLAEIKTTASLTHPHILPLHDSGEADGFLFYVMPYLEGENLRDRIAREKQLPVDDAVRIATAIASALDHAHRHNVIHRDIKPGNILLQDGEPVVADFGIALAVDVAGRDRLTETGLSLGTPHYMSPEQATGDQVVGASTDTYSLGSVLYEMLVGDPPYPGSTAQAVLGKIIAGEPPSVRAQRKSVPVNVDAAIAKALEKLPADRFAGASQFAEALTNTAFRLESTETSRRTRRKGPVMATLRASLMTLTGAAVGAALIWVFKPGAVAVGATRFTVEIPDGNMMSLGQFPNLAVSPDGRTLVYLAQGRLFGRKLDSFKSEPLEGTEGATTPFFSSDGQWIGFIRAGRFQRVPAAGGPVTNLADGALASLLGASWGEDGAILYAGSNTAKGIRRVPAIGGGAPQIITVVDSVEESTHAWPQSLDGGRLVLFTVLGRSGLWDDARVVLQDVETGERVTVVERGTFGRYVPTGHVLYVQHDGTVLAKPFDLGSRRVTGDEFPVVSGVRVGYWGGGASFAVSPAGTIAFARGSNWENYQFWWVSREGDRLEQLGSPITTEYFHISPDDRQVLVGRFQASSNDMFLLDGVTGEPDRLTFDGGHWAGVWSLDGSRIAYNATGAGQAVVYIKALDSPSEPVVIYASRNVDYPSSWSPDGKWLLVRETSPETGRDILAIGVESKDSIIVVAATSESEGSGEFSPNGRWIAYTSDGEIFVVSFPDITGKVQVSTGGGTQPRWSPVGDELFFWRGNTLMVVPVYTSASFARGTPRPLFELSGRGRDYDVSSDGTRFLIHLQRPEARAHEVYVVQNFFEELKRLVPN